MRHPIDVQSLETQHHRDEGDLVGQVRDRRLLVSTVRVARPPAHPQLNRRGAGLLVPEGRDELVSVTSASIRTVSSS